MNKTILTLEAWVWIGSVIVGWLAVGAFGLVVYKFFTIASKVYLTTRG